MGIRELAFLRSCFLLACLGLAPPAAAQTVYKYRNADGTMVYSNRLLQNAELIETFEYNFPAAARSAPPTSPAKSGAAVDERMKTHLAALDRAWFELQEAAKALAAAEARLAAGDAPLEGESTSLGSAPVTAPAAVGGPMGTVRGGGRNTEYLERQAALEVNVTRARTRLDRAQNNYNQLR